MVLDGRRISSFITAHHAQQERYPGFPDYMPRVGDWVEIWDGETVVVTHLGGPAGYINPFVKGRLHLTHPSQVKLVGKANSIKGEDGKHLAHILIQGALGK